MIKQIKHLLPSGPAWRLTKDKALKRLMSGLSSVGDDAREFADDRYLDLFPYTSTTLDGWGEQFGVPATAEAVDAAWKATGGQSKSYIEGILQAAGFDLYIHEAWVPGTEPPPGQTTSPVIRNPNLYVDGPGWIGAYVNTMGDPLMTMGAPLATMGATEQAGDGPGYVLVDGVNDYEPGDNPARWPHYVYVGAETFPQRVFVPPERRAELETLLLKLIPAHLWIVVLVTYFEDWYTEAGVIKCDATIANCEKVIPCL